MTPAATPAPVVERLRQGLADALIDQPLVERLATIGAVPAPQGFDTPAFMAREATVWAQVIREAKLSF